MRRWCAAPWLQAPDVALRADHKRSNYGRLLPRYARDCLWSRSRSIYIYTWGPRAKRTAHCRCNRRFSFYITLHNSWINFLNISIYCKSFDGIRMLDASVNGEQFVDICRTICWLGNSITITWFSIIVSISVRRAIIHVRFSRGDLPHDRIESLEGTFDLYMLRSIPQSRYSSLVHSRGSHFRGMYGTSARWRWHHTCRRVLRVCLHSECVRVACTTLHLGDNLKG